MQKKGCIIFFHKIGRLIVASGGVRKSFLRAKELIETDGLFRFSMNLRYVLTEENNINSQKRTDRASHGFRPFEDSDANDEVALQRVCVLRDYFWSSRDASWVCYPRNRVFSENAKKNPDNIREVFRFWFSETNRKKLEYLSNEEEFLSLSSSEIIYQIKVKKEKAYVEKDSVYNIKFDDVDYILLPEGEMPGVSESGLLPPADLLDTIKSKASVDYKSLSNSLSESFEAKPQNRKRLEGEPVVIAYFLPQFSRDKLNDSWYFEGFTEWNHLDAHVKYAVGHYPRKPFETIGTYDLSNNGHWKWIESTISSAAIDGLMVYKYWFEGERVLDVVEKAFLPNGPAQNIPFAFCWANQDWVKITKSSRGQERLEQSYSDQDALRFASHLSQFFCLPNYIKVEGRPLFQIYRAQDIPNLSFYLDAIREASIVSGCGEPVVQFVDTTGLKKSHYQMADAVVQRPLATWSHPTNGKSKKFLDLETLLQGEQKRTDSLEHNPKFIKTMIPNFDNTPRYGRSGRVSLFPSLKLWLDQAVECLSFAASNPSTLNRMVFINSLNEWGEQAHIEPDNVFGYSFLNTLNRVRFFCSASGWAGSQREEITINRKKSKDWRDNYFSQIPMLLEGNQLEKIDFVTFGSGSSAKSDPAECPQYLISPNSERSVESQLSRASLCLDSEEVLPPLLMKTLAEEHFSSWNGSAKGSHKRILLRDYLGLSSENVPGEFGVVGRNAKTIFPIWKTDSDFDLSELTVYIRFVSGQNILLLERAVHSICIQGRGAKIVMLVQRPLGFERQFLVLIEKLAESYGCELSTIYVNPRSFEDFRGGMLSFALKKNSSKFLMVLDYDDFFLPNSLARMVDLSNKKVSSVIGKILLENPFESPEFLPDDLSLWPKKNVFPIHSILVRLDGQDLENIQILPNQKYMEDYSLWLHLERLGIVDFKSAEVTGFVTGVYSFHRPESQTSKLARGDSAAEDILSDSLYDISQREIKRIKAYSKSES